MKKSVPWRKARGFTLMELVIVVTIIALLAAVAIPNYNQYVTSSRRADGQIALVELANRLDRYFSENNTYTGATLANVNMPAVSPEGFYNLQITTANATSYTIQAVPTGAQAGDAECATLTLNELGQKGETGSGNPADCW